MKKVVIVALVLTISLFASACGGEKGEEARIEEAIYKAEQYREAFNDGGLYAIYCFEGALKSLDGCYIDADGFVNIIDTIEAWYGEEAAEEIRDVILDNIDDFSAFEDALDSVSEEFK